MAKLTQLQLGELTKNKKDKAKTYALVVTVHQPSQSPTIVTETQTPATKAPAQVQVSNQATNPTSSSPTTAGPPLPPIHDYVNTGKRNSSTLPHRGLPILRGGPAPRGQ